MWIMNRTEDEDCHRSLYQGFTVPRQEIECILVPMEHEKRSSQYDRAVPCKRPHIVQRLNFYGKPTFAQHPRNRLGDFLR